MTKRDGFRTMVGGQALIEGVMMRGPKKYAVAVRTPEKIEVEINDIKLIKERYPILGLPLIRGVVNFFDSMVIGVRALMKSADYFPEEDEEQKGRFELWMEGRFGEKSAENLIFGIAIAFGIMMPIGLFILLPTLIVGLFDGTIGSGLVRNLLEGCIRIGIFVAYLAAVSKVGEMRRVFSYHGAEHKTIYCYEAGEELTVDNVRRQPKEHPRCGTSFLFVVMIISIILFSFAHWSNPLVRVALRLLLLPAVVSISYEFNRLVGRYDNILTRFLRAPGMLMQKLTTLEPDDSMIEVAIEALKPVIPEEKGSDAW